MNLVKQIFVFFLLASATNAQIFRLANMFEDGMVLQMKPKRFAISGFGQPGARVTVIMDDGNVTADAFVTGASKWDVVMPAQPPGGPHNFTIDQFAKDSSRATLTLNNVMIGDVWICAGEGNMKFPMRDIFNGTREMENALNYDRIHLMQVDQFSAEFELGEPIGIALHWTSITSVTVGDFPAICLLYAERLSDLLVDRHIGLIAATWEDTPIETWVSERVITLCETPPSNQTGKLENSAVWNGMISPLTRMSARGTIFAQGESNIYYNNDLYTCHFWKLTEDWRATFLDGRVNVTRDGWAFPFGFVQLGAMENEDDDSVAILRLHQTLDTEVAPNGVANETFMAPSYDLYDQYSPSGSVYYRDKLTVATRLADAAIRLIYNQTELHFVGPIPSMIWDYITSIFNTTYSWDVTIQNGPGQPSGFSYRMESGEWIEAPIIDVFEDTLSFYVHPNYTELGYAWKALPCDYKKCNVYTNSWNGMPHTSTYFQTFKEVSDQVFEHKKSIVKQQMEN